MMTTWIRRGVPGAILVLMMSGCGMWQLVKEGTVAVTQAVFETKVKQMNFVITARGALNQDARGVSLPVVLRIYQLKDGKPFATASDAQLLEGSDALKAATLWSRDVTLGPGQTLKVSEPIVDAANYVGVAAFFRDTANTEWSVLVPKSQWKKTDPVKLVAVDRTLEIDAETGKNEDSISASSSDGLRFRPGFSLFEAGSARAVRVVGVAHRCGGGERGFGWVRKRPG